MLACTNYPDVLVFKHVLLLISQLQLENSVVEFSTLLNQK
jgi:hypothetical protein